MAIAVVSVTVLIVLVLGWRESVVVAVAIPVTLALTLRTFISSATRSTASRLFALIFSIGILVDDPIVVVENIVRHFRLPQEQGPQPFASRRRSHQRSPQPTHSGDVDGDRGDPADGVCRRVDGTIHAADSHRVERGDDVLDGVAFVVTPWAAYRMLRRRTIRRRRRRSSRRTKKPQEALRPRLYRRVMGPLIPSPEMAPMFLTGMVVLLLGACSLFVSRRVKVKMLPFDNKSEFQIIVDMDEGRTLEQTARARARNGRRRPRRTRSDRLRSVRRHGGAVQFQRLGASLFPAARRQRGGHQVNLVRKHERQAQSHDIAKRVRPHVTEIAGEIRRPRGRGRSTARPAGVADIGGGNLRSDRANNSLDAGAKGRDIFHQTPGVVDTDWYIEADQPKTGVLH